MSDPRRVAGSRSLRHRRLAAANGIGEKIGRNWTFTARDLEQLRKVYRGKPGRPKND